MRENAILAEALRAAMAGLAAIGGATAPAQRSISAMYSGSASIAAWVLPL